MKKTKENNGITLIALVVIIIVALILSAFTLNLVIKEYGFFQKADSARYAAVASACQDRIRVAILTSKTDHKGEVDLKILADELPKLDTNITVETYNDGDTELNGKYQYNEDFYYNFKIDENLEITGETKRKWSNR